MNERDRLRREIARRRKAATDKILRLRKSKGINVQGTEHDPRQDFNKVKNYNTKQLRDYLKSLNEFTNKDTTFRLGARNTILSDKLWQEYKGLESRYNAIGAQHVERIKDITLPDNNLTIGENTEDVLRKRSHGDIFQRPYGKIVRNPQNIESNESLSKLTADLKKKLDKSYLPSKIGEQRERLKDILTTIGNPKWQVDENGKRTKEDTGNWVSGIDLADQLTDYQFYVFYNYGGGASSTFMYYSYYKMLNAHQAARFEDDFADDVSGLFDWASKLPRNAPRTPKK